MKEYFNFTDYFVDFNIWKCLKNEIKIFDKILIITGEKSFNAIKNKLIPILKHKNYKIVKYNGECSYENLKIIFELINNENFRLVIGIGGGKAIDTSKIIAQKLNLSLFVVPTIASNCSGTSSVSVVYEKAHSFKELFFLNTSPNKIFIDLETLKKAPNKYVLAGIGDTLAKYYEIALKKENLKKENFQINFPSLMGIKLSYNCKEIILKNSKVAYFNSKVTEEFKLIVLTIIVNTGMTSNLVDEYFNGGIAHSIFYGLTILPEIEKKYLHGEIVAFGILVQLLIEEKWSEYRLLLSFYKELYLPMSLKKIVSLDKFLEKEEKILEKILTSPDLYNFDFNLEKKKLKKWLLY